MNEIGHRSTCNYRTVFVITLSICATMSAAEWTWGNEIVDTTKTRMHSSRMRTVRSSGRISGGVPGPEGCTWSGGTWSRGGVYLVLGGVLGPRGCTWSGTPPLWTDTHLIKHNLCNFVADGNKSVCVKDQNLLN